jgi:peptidoglycan-associated lipoprotein
MKHKQMLVLSAAVLVTLAGCSSTGTVPGDESAFGSTGAGGVGGSSGSTFGNEFGGSGEFIADDGVGPGGDLLDDLVVYFDYDSSEIRADFNEMLAAHGQYLATNANASVRLEGHADERGSREYNIGLGERRAQQVRQILLLQGASVSQLSTVSYGEEQPAVFGSDEESYQLNRRVEIVYR